jgi:hypothetical protein
MRTPAVFTGAMNAAQFAAYVQQCLLSSVCPGDIAVMDNLSPHKGMKVRRLFAGAGVGYGTCCPTVRT